MTSMVTPELDSIHLFLLQEQRLLFSEQQPEEA